MNRSIGTGSLGVLLVVLGTAGPCLAASPPAKNRDCPYGKAYSDGCAHAYPDGNFVNGDFFAYAKQLGQGNYYSALSAWAIRPLGMSQASTTRWAMGCRGNCGTLRWTRFRLAAAIPPPAAPMAARS